MFYSMIFDVCLSIDILFKIWETIYNPIFLICYSVSLSELKIISRI